MFSEKYIADNEHITPSDELLHSISIKMKNYDASKDENIRKNPIININVRKYRTALACLLLFFVTISGYTYLSNHGLLINTKSEMSPSTTTTDSDESYSNAETYDFSSKSNQILDGNTDQSIDSTTARDTESKIIPSTDNTNENIDHSTTDKIVTYSDSRTKNNTKTDKHSSLEKEATNTDHSNHATSKVTGDINHNTHDSKNHNIQESTSNNIDTTSDEPTAKSDTAETGEETIMSSENQIDLDTAFLATLNHTQVKMIEIITYPQDEKKILKNSTNINLIVDCLNSVELYEEYPSAADLNGRYRVCNLSLQDDSLLNFIVSTPYIFVNNTWYRANETSLDKLSNLIDQLIEN